MNALFSPDLEPILADVCVGISGLKKNPAAVIAAAREQQVAILNRNRPVAYMVSPEVWERVCDLVDDFELGRLMDAREGELSETIPVSLDEL